MAPWTSSYGTTAVAFGCGCYAAAGTIPSAAHSRRRRSLSRSTQRCAALSVALRTKKTHAALRLSPAVPLNRIRKRIAVAIVNALPEHQLEHLKI